MAEKTCKYTLKKGSTNIYETEPRPAYIVDDDGIYRYIAAHDVYERIMTKEAFIEAYYKYVRKDNNV